MNNPEIFVKEQENPVPPEPREPVGPQEGGVQQPVAAQPAEQNVRPATPPPYVPPGSSSAWPSYYAGTRPPWGEQPRPSYPRRRSPWPWILVTLLVLFVLLTGGALLLFGLIGNTFYSSSLTETRHFSVSANSTLILNNDTGSLHVRAVPSGNDVSIQATKHSGLGGNLNDIKVSYTQDTAANTITVNVDRQPNLFNSASVDFDIAVPSTAILQLNTNTGSIDVNGVSGQMVLSSNTGSIEVSNGTVSGNTQLKTNTGSITFNGAIAGSGNYRFETNTGSVNVRLPGESVFHVDASTDTGSINTSFPGVTVEHHQALGADAHGDVGSSPQATITLRTNTGSINLYQS